jgi:hypothetical protein
MKWQWKLGNFAGIDVYIHATFLLLIGWVGYSHWLENQNWGEVLSRRWLHPRSFSVCDLA